MKRSSLEKMTENKTCLRSASSHVDLCIIKFRAKKKENDVISVLRVAKSNWHSVDGLAQL